jgi:hypothetical protein
MSVLQWFNAREATAAGSSLADEFEPKAAATLIAAGGKDTVGALQEFLTGAERTVSALKLNFYKRAKLANSFKWRLLEKGVDKPTADAVTSALVMHLLTNSGGAPAVSELDDDQCRSRQIGKRQAAACAGQRLLRPW